MKKIYGLIQKYNLKDFVKYYQSRNQRTGEPCNIQFGYIVCVAYSLNELGEPQMEYTISDSPFRSCGYLVNQSRIIRKATPKDRKSIVSYLNWAIQNCDNKKLELDKAKEELIAKRKEIEQ